MKIKLDSETVNLGLTMYYAEEDHKKGYHCPKHTWADDILADWSISEELFHHKTNHCGMCE